MCGCKINHDELRNVSRRARRKYRCHIRRTRQWPSGRSSGNYLFVYKLKRTCNSACYVSLLTLTFSATFLVWRNSIRCREKFSRLNFKRYVCKRLMPISRSTNDIIGDTNSMMPVAGSVTAGGTRRLGELQVWRNLRERRSDHRRRDVV